MKHINWKDWFFVIVFGILFLGNVSAGPFVIPSSAETVGYDALSLIIWALFFWSCVPFVKAMRRKS